ncbi:hypothetical protein G7046_g6373 [Stylonectria norvegica]|nr:hypothetical protein G7046_g6373 [Stylonectria norvegica]
MHLRAKRSIVRLLDPTHPNALQRRSLSLSFRPGSNFTFAMSSDKQPLMAGARKPIPRGHRSPWLQGRMAREYHARVQGRVEVGAHALETDVHLSADGVVVLSHDPSLKRCYGAEKKISECKWDYLSTLKTLRAPHEGLPRLRDLLEYLVEPGLEKTWIDDEAVDLISAIAKTLDDVSPSVPWDERIVLGCWNATFLQTARRLLPTYPLAHIGASILYSQHFLAVPNLGFNMNQKAMIGPPGRWFMRKCQKTDKQLFLWTVNEERWMRWSIRKNLGRGKRNVGKPLIDGVITDDPKLYLEVCQRYEDELDGRRAMISRGVVGTVQDGMSAACLVVMMQVLIMGFHILRRAQGKFDYLKDRKNLDKR